VHAFGGLLRGAHEKHGKIIETLADGIGRCFAKKKCNFKGPSPVFRGKNSPSGTTSSTDGPFSTPLSLIPGKKTPSTKVSYWAPLIPKNRKKHQ
jgi:hypothetical protein